jgi:hypothetical protein
MPRQDARRFRLKAAMADLIERCGGQERAGELIGLSQQMMSCVCRREHSAVLSRENKLVLELECGAPVVTSVEAEMLGYRLEPIEPRTVEPDGTPFEAHAAVIAEVADLCRTFSRSVADGRYSHTDAVTVGRDLAELRRSIERFERVNAATLAGGAA